MFKAWKAALSADGRRERASPRTEPSAASSDAASSDGASDDAVAREPAREPEADRGPEREPEREPHEEETAASLDAAIERGWDGVWPSGDTSSETADAAICAAALRALARLHPDHVAAPVLEAARAAGADPADIDAIAAGETDAIGRLTAAVARGLPRPLALADEMRDAAAIFGLADRARDAGRPVVAACLYHVGLTVEPGAAAFEVQLGHMLKDTGARRAATDAYRRALRRLGADGDVWLNLGRALASAGHRQAALAAFERAERLDGPGGDATVHAARLRDDWTTVWTRAEGEAEGWPDAAVLLLESALHVPLTELPGFRALPAPSTDALDDAPVLAEGGPGPAPSAPPRSAGDAPDRAALAGVDLGRLHGPEDPRGAAARDAVDAFAWLSGLRHGGPPPRLRPATSTSTAGLGIVHLAWVDARTLRLRLRVEADTAVRDLEGWQVVNGALRPCPIRKADEPGATGDVEARMRVADRFAPLLIVGLDASEAIETVRLVAFPSLAPGGLHEVELLAAAADGSPAVLRERLDFELASDLVAQRDRGRPSVAFDLAGAQGDEPATTEPLAPWLRDVFAVDVTLAGLQAAPSGARLGDWIESGGVRLADRPPEDADLVVPSDGWPTIAALVGLPRGPAAPKGGRRVAGGHFAVVGWDGVRFAEVRVPPAGEWLVEAQEGAPAWFARVRADGDAERPVVVRRLRASESVGPQALFPPGRDAPVARGRVMAGRADAAPIEVHLPLFEVDETALVACLESLAVQTAAASIEIAAIAPAAEAGPSPMVRAVLDRAFPGRWRRVRCPVGATRVEALAAGFSAARSAPGAVVAWPSPDATLADPRALDDLARLARRSEAGLVGCRAVTPRDRSIHFADAGLTVSARDGFDGAPSAFAPLREIDAIGGRVAPVLAPGPGLALVALDAAREAGGPDPARPDVERMIVDLAERLAALGRTSLTDLAHVAVVDRPATGGAFRGRRGVEGGVRVRWIG